MKQTIELHKKWKADPSKGEVFTPSELVREMLDKIPSDVWENPESKFLDPCMGKGTFIIEIVKRLIDIYGYSKEDAISRVYGYDTCVKYVNHLKRGGFVNIFHKDFLNEELNMKFDVVVGNPPYQEKNTATGNNIYQKFVEKAYGLSEQYVVMIHPSSWRMPLREQDSFFKLSQIIKNNAEYVKILTQEQSKEFFGLSLKLDYYLLNKRKSSSKLTILENNVETKQINLLDYSFIPHYNFDLMRVFTNNPENQIKVVYSYVYDPRNTYVSSENTNEFCYPLIHSTPKNGIRFKYSSINNKGHFGIPKVIFGESGINDVIIDMNGQYGMTQGAIGIQINSIQEGEKIKNALLSENFQKFISGFIWSNFRIDWRLFTYLKQDFWKEFIDE